MILKPGMVIKFLYKHKFADDSTGPPQKEVFVLHPKWRDKVHGIDLRRLTVAERDVLESIVKPRGPDGTWPPHRLQLVNDIRRRMDPIEEIKNPLTFYVKFVKFFLRKKDAYRMYYPRSMIDVTRVEGDDAIGGHRKVRTPFDRTKKEEPKKATPPPLRPGQSPPLPNPARDAAEARREAINRTINQLKAKK